ncbi:MAG: glycosyltransferase family 2 protein [Terriglobales bacterium]|jgi:dolichol-phosphate mannosyltransferase
MHSEKSSSDDACDAGSIDNPSAIAFLPSDSPNRAPATERACDRISVPCRVIDLAVVVPTYNERPNIRPLVERLSRCLSHLNWEVIFVDDDSPDCTPAEVRSLGELDRRVRVLQRIGRKGLSSACIEGMLATSAGYIAVMDADLQHDETLLPKMFARIEAGDVDLVVATRNADGGSKGSFARHRVVMSDLAARLSSLVCKTQLSDPMSGFFLIRRKCFLQVAHSLSGVGFKILVDIVASNPCPLRVVEVPYVFRERQFGESKLDLNVTLEYFNLLIDKFTRGVLPARFVMFMLVGGTGVGVHLSVLALLYAHLRVRFILAQTLATAVAMTTNFFLNNMLTFRDKRLKKWGLLRGLLLFYLACSFGAFTNVTVAQFAFGRQFPWFIAGFIGVAVSSVWNYAVNSLFTWRRSH